MTIEVTAGKKETRGEGFQSRDTSTGTLSLTTDYSLIVGSTTTDDYSLADGTDGQTKEIIMTSTGQATVHLTGTSTGALVFNAADDFVGLKFLNSKWRLFVNSGATVATAT